MVPEKNNLWRLRAIKKLSVGTSSCCVQLSHVQFCPKTKEAKVQTSNWDHGLQRESTGGVGRNGSAPQAPLLFRSIQLPRTGRKFAQDSQMLEQPSNFSLVHAEWQVPQRQYLKYSLIKTIIRHKKYVYSHTRAGNLCLVLKRQPRSKQWK